MEDLILKLIESDIETKARLKEQAPKIAQVASHISKALEHGGKLVLFGNGGSAADSQHIAAEFVSKKKAALALTTDTSALTAIANDFAFEEIFERQVEALCKEEDIVIGISTSGDSENVIRGIQAANRRGAFTVGFTGLKGGSLSEVANLVIHVESESTPEVQQSHILIGHILAELCMRA